jgi:hypothetical protein
VSVARRAESRVRLWKRWRQIEERNALDTVLMVRNASSSLCKNQRSGLRVLEEEQVMKIWPLGSQIESLKAK